MCLGEVKDSHNSICRISIRRVPCYPVRNPLGFWFFLLQNQFAIPDFLLSRMKSFESWQSGISSCDCKYKKIALGLSHMSIFSDPGARNNDKQPISPCPENFSHLISRRMKPSVVRLIIYSTVLYAGGWES
ncbi:hypothetical protein P167DRAFT_323874 [Morchella conica CCBAS932]|uniref:Uncharacterized protein n=1 Tax=Morchella conica CCBAS932 TaxID=1392247 RepID=A0A3N4KEX5_9PEZI|nr:hypothetical protein P167DRAFT_323874 [Morchella conica CCBAS932]